MTDKVATLEELARLAYAASIRLLARRDHSIFELTQKLKKREHSDNAIDSAVQELLDANYLNEERYADLFAEQRMNQGYGPLVIRAKLSQRGIPGHLIQSAIRGLQVDWALQAEQVIHKRFNCEDISDPDQKVVAKIARFIQARGFVPSDAVRALKNARLNLEQ
ncbi:MAG: regulatory protein RecX [Granulosicoccus sp.]